MHLGKVQRNTDILPTDLFKEIKKNVVLSKKKMGEMCKTLRKFKVQIAPNIMKKLHDIDHLLDNDYETIRIKVKETVTEDMKDCEDKDRKDKMIEKEKVKKIVEVEKDVTLLKDTKGFIVRMAQERNLWKSDILNRISIDKGDNSLKFIVTGSME